MTPGEGREHSRLNLPLLLMLLAIVGVVGAGAFVWHQRQKLRIAEILLERAVEQEGRGELGQAMQGLFQYLELRPDDAGARVRLARIAGKSAASGAEKSRAIELLEHALRLEPGDGELRRHKAELLLELGRPDAAVEEADRLLKSGPQETLAAAWRVKALGLAAQYEPKGRIAAKDVTQSLETALQYQPGDVRLASALADDYRAHTETPQEGDRVMDALVTACGDSAKALLARYAYRRKHELDGCRQDLERAQRIAPDDIDVLLAIGEFQLAEKRPEAAIAALEKVARNWPDDRRGYLALAQAYRAASKPREAADALRRQVEKGAASDIALRLLLAAALLDVAKQAPSQAHLDEAQQEITALSQLLETMRGTMDDSDVALTGDAVKLLEIDRFLAQGNDAQAARLLREVAAAVPKSRDAKAMREETGRRHLLLGEVYSRLRQWDLAAAAFKDATRHLDKPATAQLAAAEALERAGQLTNASAEYHALIQAGQAPSNGWLLLARAELAEQLQRKKDQRQWARFNEAIEQAIASRSQKPSAADKALAQALILKAQGAAAQQGQAAAVRELDLALERAAQEVLPSAVLLFETWGRPQRADAALQRLAKQPGADKLSVDLLQSELLLRRKQLDAARNILEEQLRSGSSEQHRFLRLRLARIDLAAGQTEAARARLRRLCQDNEADLEPLEQLAELALHLGHVEDLKFCDERLENLEGESGSLWRFFRGMRLVQGKFARRPPASTSGDRGQTPASDPEIETAQRLLRELKALRPDWPSTYVLQGHIDQCLGELRHAIEAYQRATDLGTDNIAVYEWLLSLLYEEGRFEEAAVYLDRLQRAFYRSPRLAVLAPNVLLQTGKFAEAVAVAAEGARLRKTDPMSHVWLGHTATIAADHASDEAERKRLLGVALEAFQEARKIKPGDYRTWAGLLWFHARRKESLLARQLLAEFSSPSDSQPKIEPWRRSLLLAEGYQLIGDTDEAERHYRQSAEAKPGDMELQERLARFYLGVNAVKAEAQYERCLQLAPQSDRIRRTLAALLAVSGDEAKFERAMDLLRRSPRDGKDQVELTDQRIQAVVLLQHGGTSQRQEAKRILAECVKTKPEPVDCLLLANAYERDGQVSESKGQYQQLLDAFPNPPPGYLAEYVAFLLRRGLLEECEPPLRQLEAGQQNAVRAAELRIQWLKLRGAEARELEAVVQRFRNTHSETVQDDPRKKLELLLAAARLHDQAEQFAQAETIHQTILQERLKEPPYVPYATWLTQRRRFDEAARLCLKHVPVAGTPSAELAIHVTGVLTVWVRQKDVPPAADDPTYRACEQLVTQAAAAHPKDTSLLFHVGTLRFMQDRREEAVGCYERLLRINPRHVATMNNLALLLSQDRLRAAEALKIVEEARGLAPQSREIRNSLALVLLNLGNTEKALPMLEKLAAERAQHAGYQLHLAWAYSLTNAAEKSRGAFASAVDKGIDSAPLSPQEESWLRKLHERFPQPPRKKKN